MTVHVVTVDVLTERAPERDVDHLLSAADAEDRDARIDRGADERDLGEVERQVDVRGLLLSRLAVHRRIDVPAPWDEEPVDPPDDRGRAVGLETLGLGVERDRGSTRGLDRTEVGGVVLGPAQRAACDADLWLGHVRILCVLAAWSRKHA